ncbi:MAG: B12-binding domain-containing radical SAM protein [Desulfobacterales bacterium]|nr:B12-binding domain-containing radical SAM protein [Desulfobacterales bacterium]
MTKKILFLYPNSINDGVMPLAIGILSGIAKELKCKVDYFETSFYRKEDSVPEERERTGEFKVADRSACVELLPRECLKKDFFSKIKDFKPDILAVTANSIEFEKFEDLMDRAQEIQHRPFTIIGGVHPTVAPEEVIKNSFINALCRGEGENAWKEFLSRFIKNQDISTIKNLWVKTGSGIKKNPIGPLITEDKLWARPLDYSFFDKRHFTAPFDGKIYHRGQIEASRGCPFSCTYCANTATKKIYQGLGKFVRIRPLDNLANAVRKQVEMGCEMIQFQDECFLRISYDNLKNFCMWYGNEIKLPMMVQTRPESVSEEKIQLLAGMNTPVQISCGIESGSERILFEICNRKTRLAQIKKAFEIIKKYNIRATGYTMTGFPTETREEVFQTIHFIRELDIDISIMSIFYPFIGTPLREFCIEKGYITGREKTINFTDPPILKNQPMPPMEIYNIRRVYSLYTRLPLDYFPQIERCEKDFDNNQELYRELISLMYKSYYKSWKLN